MQELIHRVMGSWHMHDKNWKNKNITKIQLILTPGFSDTQTD